MAVIQIGPRIITWVRAMGVPTGRRPLFSNGLFEFGFEIDLNTSSFCVN